MNQNAEPRAGNWLTGTSGSSSRAVRIISVIGILFLAVNLLVDHDDLGDWVTAVMFGGLLSLNVVPPRGLHDGRFSRWSERHPVLGVALIGVFFYLTFFGVLTSRLSHPISALVAVPIGLGMALRIGLLEIRRRRARSRRR